ncbi:hypothetical protein BV22DRAFT_1096259 [Leucogyrophana mollusca]|uniref:Uncharacterized protein n=1 Tax=Leucogyrophana mollusca TaxID=85980 RepID=A0ACB8B6Y0_9AGAM|nr:hypothetical protein BV22DRAFT_1096259 [Leucogyrophana mollusca]
MAKGQKSSATSGTRKKNARKAGAGNPPPEIIPKEKKPKGKNKGQNKEPKKKVYILPVKPAPIQPDPLDTTGLVHHLPPELVIVLRSLGKKDPVTKAKALEELQSKWVDESTKQGGDSLLSEVLVAMLPVWLHRAPVLFTHPARRIRVLAAGFHVSLLRIPAVRDAVIFFVQESATTDQVETLLSTWCMLSYDLDRQVSSIGSKSWADIVSLAPGLKTGKLVVDASVITVVLSFIQRTLLDPSGVYMYLNPSPVVAPPPTAKKVGGRYVPPPSKEELQESSRSKSESEEESEPDRNARLRVAAFGALRWILDARLALGMNTLDGLKDFLCNLALWTSLHPAESCAFVQMESFGFGQPQVRQSAWNLLSSLLQRWKGNLSPMLPILSTVVLRSAWIETDAAVRGTMSQPLLIFLKEFPSAWVLDAAYDPNKQDDDESDSDGEDGEVQGKEESTFPRGPSSEGQSQAYREFLQFLELGCAGSPVEGYPMVVIILSTIPSSIISNSSQSPLTDFFTSFWAAIDGRALSSIERKIPSTAFLSALLECMVFLIRRISNGSQDHAALLSSESGNAPDTGQEIQKLVKEQFTRLWDELVSRKLRVDDADAGKLMGKTLVILDRMGGDLFLSAWNALAAGIKIQSHPSPSLASSVMKVFVDSFDEGTTPSQATHALIAEVVQINIAQCEESLGNEACEKAELAKHIGALVTLIDTFGSALFQHNEFALRTDDMVIRHSIRLLEASPKLILAYLSYRGDQQRCKELWHSLLSAIADDAKSIHSSLPPLLDAARNGVLSSILKPESDALDGPIEHLFVEVISGPAQPPTIALVRQLIQTPEYFLSTNGLDIISETLVSYFTSKVEEALYNPNSSIIDFAVSISLIHTIVQSQSQLAFSPDATASLLPSVFLVAYLFPICHTQDTSTTTNAQGVWKTWSEQATPDLLSVVTIVIKDKLRGLLSDCTAYPTPEHILSLVGQKPSGMKISILHDILPSQEELDAMLDDLPSEPASPSLALLDPCIPPSTEFEDGHVSGLSCDSRGYSPYVRVVSALLQCLSEDRQLAKDNVWALRHVLVLSRYIQDFLEVPASRSGLLDGDTPVYELRNILSKTQQLTTYLLSSSLIDDGLHPKVVSACLAGGPRTNVDGLSNLLVDLIDHAKNEDTVRDSLALRAILQHLFANATKADSEQWILLARKLEKSAPQTSIAIVWSITEFAPEPSRLDRYRNELASDMLGIPARKANTDGLLCLRRLAATAPDPDSEVVFLQQQRAVNVMKVCQQWISSDENIDEEVESMMTLIFFHLAPILQNVSGAHWDFIYDILENNFENCSFSEDATLTALGRSLRLVLLIDDLVLTNKSLRASWEERRLSILTLVRNLVSADTGNTEASSPRSLCRELALSIIQELPKSLMDEQTLPQMCHLLYDQSSVVLRMSYQLLSEAARKRTEHYVIEAAVDTEDSVQAELPMELVTILQQSMNMGDGLDERFDEPPGAQHSEIFGYLLAWMVTFDLFADASLKVRSSYFNHMRNLDIIATSFIPNVFDVLDLYSGGKKAFKLDVWAVDEYYLNSFDSEDALSLRLLAAHLYHRALLTVPALIRTWISDCTDKQLLTRVVDYTSSYFSPGIIRAELSLVRQPESSSELTNTENLAIKVSPSAGEVTASYTVDDQVLELTVRMPADWPLHRLEVRDTKMIGVSEDRWRAWVLGVQQIVWQQNGRIVDGLTLFTKNVSLHFAGQVECAICYSIISVMDGSLPQKPCKTCRNRFHAGCLYKWFKTSHSSSCPLCRSDIL